MKYHVVWCPKYRRKILIGDIAARLNQIICEVCKEIQAEIIALAIMPEHVHLLLDIPPQLDIANVMQRIKGRASRILRMEFPLLKILPALWARGYYSGFVREDAVEVVRRYILNHLSRKP